MLRNILVHVDNTPRAAVRVDLAVNLARAHGARLTGLFVVDASYRDGSSEEEGGATWTTQAAVHAERLFRVRTDGAAIPVAWKTIDGEIVAMVARMAQRSDLAIIGQDGAPDTNPNIGTAARIALVAGRPVLVVPARGEFPVIGHRVLVAWSDSREAARALNDAMPILASADHTVVLLVNPTECAPGVDGTADISDQLSAHGIKAVFLRAFANRIDTGNTILTRAREAGVDLVVMGARGVLSTPNPTLGQTTRHVLASMTIPVLMSG
jgi:nucleotide-binding universal stress UspA family protein